VAQVQPMFLFGFFDHSVMNLNHNILS